MRQLNNNQLDTIEGASASLGEIVSSQFAPSCPLKKDEKMRYSKEYEIGKKKIIESDFSVKSVKTFMGMEGYGINANIYFKNKKIGHIIDSGNGGCLDIKYYIGDKWMHKNEDVNEFISKLPRYTIRWKDVAEPTESKFDDEEMWNVLVNEYLFIRDFKKDMKKIQILHNDEVFTFTRNNKPTHLDKKYRYKGKDSVSYRDILKNEFKGCTILNDIKYDDAISLYRTYATN